MIEAQTPNRGGEIIHVFDLREQPVAFEVSPILAQNTGFQSDLLVSNAARIAVFNAPRLISLKLGRIIDDHEAYFDHASLLLSWRDLYSYDGKAYKALSQTLEAASIWLNPAYAFLPLLAHRRLLKARNRSLNLELALIALAKTLFGTGSEFIAALKRGYIGTPSELFEDHIRILRNKRLSLYLNASISEIEDALLTYAIRFTIPLPRFKTSTRDLGERLAFLWKFVSKLEEYKKDDPWHLVSLAQKAVNPDVDVTIFPDDIDLS